MKGLGEVDAAGYHDLGNTDGTSLLDNIVFTNASDGLPPPSIQPKPEPSEWKEPPPMVAEETVQPQPGISKAVIGVAVLAVLAYLVSNVEVKIE